MHCEWSDDQLMLMEGAIQFLELGRIECRPRHDGDTWEALFLGRRLACGDRTEFLSPAAAAKAVESAAQEALTECLGLGALGDHHV